MKLLETIYTPQESVNDDFLSLLTVMVKSGDPIKKGQLIAEMETSKAVVEVHSPADGYILVHVQANTDVKVGTRMFEVFDSPVSGDMITPAITTTTHAVAASHVQETAVVNTVFSKAALAYIEKNNIDKNRFKGLAFVTTKDIIPRHGKTNDTHIISPAAQPLAASVVKEVNPSAREIKPITASKKREYEYLSSVNGPSVVSRLSVFINVSNPGNIGKAQRFISSTPLPTIIYEVSRLLLKYPNLNSFYNNGSQAFYNNIHVGFALDDGVMGLKVAALFDSDKLSSQEIEESISSLSQKYVSNQLSVTELTSSTFTITDLFNSPVQNFHPLVNINNSAVLGVSGFDKSGFVLDLSFDHRITSGKEVSLFLGDLKQRLEARFRLGSEAKEERQHVQCQKCLRSIDDDVNGNIFFQKVVNSKYDGYVCSNCLNGW